MISWIILLIALGLLLLLIEIFFVPGIAIAGLLGLTSLVAGIYLIAQEYGPLHAVTTFFGSLSFIIVAFVVFFRSPAAKYLILEGKITERDVARGILEKGAKGVSITPLYPTGKAAFVIEGKEKRVDVSTNGEFIEEGTQIKVSRVEGNRIFVTELES